MTMTQDEMLSLLKEDSRQSRQLKVMLRVIDYGFRDNMAAYARLVQMDAVREFNRRCEIDGVGGERVRFGRETLDPILRQIDADLQRQIMAQFDRMKGYVGTDSSESYHSPHPAQADAASAQQEQILTLLHDERQLKMVSVMFKIIDEAFINNMQSYIKLVQMETMKDFSERCDEDGVGGERVEFCHKVLDPLLIRVNDDLKTQIMSQFARVKEMGIG